MRKCAVPHSGSMLARAAGPRCRQYRPVTSIAGNNNPPPPPQDRHRGRGAGGGAVRRHDGHHLRRGGSEQGVPRGRQWRDARQGQRRRSVHRWGGGPRAGGAAASSADLNSQPGTALQDPARLRCTAPPRPAQPYYQPGADVCLPSNPAGQAMASWDLSQLHHMSPDEAAKMATFTITNGNSTITYRVGGSADESPGRLRLCRPCASAGRGLCRRSFRSPRWPSTTTTSAPSLPPSEAPSSRSTMTACTRCRCRPAGAGCCRCAASSAPLPPAAAPESRLGVGGSR